MEKIYEIVKEGKGVTRIRDTGELVRCRDCGLFEVCTWSEGSRNGFCAWPREKNSTVEAVKVELKNINDDSLVIDLGAETTLAKQKETHLYPVTIINDRYGGTYSGGEWLAFNLYEDKVPIEASGDDVTCMNFWYEKNSIPIGKGKTPEEALLDLERQVEER